MVVSDIALASVAPCFAILQYMWMLSSSSVIIIFVLQLSHACNDELMAKGLDAMTKWQ